MKASRLVEHLNNHIKDHGDSEVSLEAELNGGRTEQKLFDVLSGNNQVLLVSKEAMDADPINQLPTIQPEPIN